MCGLVILVVFFNEVKAKISATTRNGTNIQKIQFQDN